MDYPILEAILSEKPEQISAKKVVIVQNLNHPGMQQPEILLKPLHELPVSQFFKQASAAMGFRTLGDIVSTAPADLQDNKNFNYVWLGELIEVLKEIGLLHLLQPTQGNSRV